MKFGSASNVQYEEEQEKEFDLFDMLITNKTVTLSATRDSKFVFYENQHEIHRNENPLEWWYVNRTKYPTLSQLAYTYVCITGTSVPSERTFSTAGHLTFDRSSRLTPKMQTFSFS